MKYEFFKKVLISAVIAVLVQSGIADDKLAQTGFQFLSVTPDARSAAMAGAMTTVRINSSALWSNPAMLAGMNSQIELMANYNQWIADIKHNAVTAAFRPAEGRYGVLGFSLQYVDYGDVEATLRASNEQGYIDIGLIHPSAYSVGLAYARQLTTKFSVGGQVKYVYQDLGPAISRLEAQPYESKTNENQLSVLAFDFGTSYRTGFKSLVFGMSVRNFSEEIAYVDEGFQLPLTFNIGASVDLMDFSPTSYEGHALLFSVDAVHPRSYHELLRVATEYSYNNFFFVRLGYISSRDEEGMTYGFGLEKFGVGFDYAYTPFGVFDNVQRFSLFLKF